MPKSPPKSASLKPLYQWLSSPAVMCPRPSICVATLSLMNSALLCQRVLLELDLRIDDRLFLRPFAAGRAKRDDLARRVARPLVAPPAVGDAQVIDLALLSPA